MQKSPRKAPAEASPRTSTPAVPAKYGRGTGIPNPVDVHVGARIRMRRLLLGMNQESLAKALGLTFQQVQKYEGGSNRVSASRLSSVAKILGVPVGYFYSDLPQDTDDAGDDRQWREYLQRPETIELIRAYYAIRDSKTRSNFLELVKSVAPSGAGA